MSTPTILFIDHATAIGGAEKSLLLLLRQLVNNNWSCHVIGQEGKFLKQAASLNLSYSLVTLPRLRRSRSNLQNWYKNAKHISTIATQADASAIYANTVRAAMYSSLASRWAKRPFIWHMRDFWLTETKPQHMFMDQTIKRLLCRSATKIIANSQAVAAHLPSKEKVSVVHNGIDLTHFSQAIEVESWQNRFDIPPEAPLIGMVGRLRPWKGQLTFLKIAQQVLTTMPQAYFVIVGGATFSVQDDYPEQLKKKAQALGIADKVIFTGSLNDVRPALAAMDVFVHPGEPEPFGLVNVEAMAMAKPVVAFAHGALPEIVVDGQTGFLAPPGDISAMSQHILHLMNQPELRRNFGENGRARVKTHFTIQRTTQEIESILESIVNKST